MAMSHAKRSNRKSMEEGIYDALASSPDGLTRTEIVAALADKGIHRSRTAVSSGIRGLRLLFGDSHDVNIVCDSPGDGYSEWKYRLVGRMEDAAAWIKWRKMTLLENLRTALGVAKSMQTAASTSQEKRETAATVRTISRLIEDLEDSLL
jgi:arginine repressor